MGLDDGLLFRLYNGVADAAHDVVSTVLGCVQDGEGGTFTFGGVHQAVVYAVQFLLGGAIFIDQVAQFNCPAVDFLKQYAKLPLILFKFLFGCIIGKPLTQGGCIGLSHCLYFFDLSSASYS